MSCVGCMAEATLPPTNENHATAESEITMKAVDAVYDMGISHNKFPLTLPDGTYYPDYLFNVDKRPSEFLTHFNRVRDRDWADCSFLDLGCSEGSTTHGLSQMGSTVYGVEGRADGVERAKRLAGIVGFDKTHFSVGNVDFDEAYRPVDGIFNAGVLYHLEDPVACMERCAANARLFMMVDTGHAPRSQQEREESRFATKFGKTYQIDYDGLKLDVVDFAEPGQTEEKQKGVRRGPRAGIGNTNSVWLAHASLIELMKKLGFPHHQTIADKPAIPRLRTMFWRDAPRPLEPLGAFLRPLPTPARPADAINAAKARDLAYLKRSGAPVTVIGHDPYLSTIADELRAGGANVDAVITAPGELGDVLHLRMLEAELAGRSGHVVIATPGVQRATFNLMKLDRFDYAFTSFSMAQEQARA